MQDDDTPDAGVLPALVVIVEEDLLYLAFQYGEILIETRAISSCHLNFNADGQIKNPAKDKTSTIPYLISKVDPITTQEVILLLIQFFRNASELAAISRYSSGLDLR
jgi:hypothetical protein